MSHDPFRHLSRGLVEAVTHDPAFVAMTEGNGVIQTTWGDLASRLAEAEVVEADPAAICDFLYITPEQLCDPALILTKDGADNKLEAYLEERIEEDYVASYAPLAKADSERFVATSSEWEVNDAEVEVTSLEEDFNVRKQAISEVDEDDHWRARTELVLSSLHINALQSGVCVNLVDFITSIASAEGLEYFTPADAINAAYDVVDGIFENHSLDRGVPLSTVYFGRKQITDFQNNLVWQFRGRIRQQQQERWDILREYVYAGSVYDHPLLAGNEQ